MASSRSHARAGFRCPPGPPSSAPGPMSFVADAHGRQQNTRVSDPTKPQPLTDLQIVSPDASLSQQQQQQQQQQQRPACHAPHHMTRPFSPSGPLSAVASSDASAAAAGVGVGARGSSPHNAAAVASGCGVTDLCVSPPCDKADCDEATICYEHSALQHDARCADHERCQDSSSCFGHLQCQDGLDCHDAACGLDWLCTDLACHENDCHQDHSQLCATACDDPSCREDSLYCCLSDVCPHRPHTDCPEPCVDHCRHPHPDHVCHLPPPPPPPPPPAACGSHPALARPASALASAHDAMSCSATSTISTISTPNTETAESVATPDHFQALIEAASTLPPPAAFAHAFQPPPPPKRMRTDRSSPLIHDFHVPFYASQEYWPFDFHAEYPSAAAQTKPPPLPLAVSPVKHAVRKSTSPRRVDQVPQCRWQDGITGACDMTFSTIEELHNHVKEHTGQLVPSKISNRNFVCRWLGCEKAAPFGTKNHLDRHMQNHTRFKPFACSVCGHRCVTQQQLNNHLTTHSREKKFKCDFPGCNKVFGVKTALSTHKRTHTNEKPFSCRWCGDSYSDSSNLSKHRKTVHEDDKTAIPCPEDACPYKDSRAQRLERHCRETHHGLALLSDTHKWSEYTRKKQVRSRTASVAPSAIAV